MNKIFFLIILAISLGCSSNKTPTTKQNPKPVAKTQIKPITPLGFDIIKIDEKYIYLKEVKDQPQTAIFLTSNGVSEKFKKEISTKTTVRGCKDKVEVNVAGYKHNYGSEWPGFSIAIGNAEIKMDPFTRSDEMFPDIVNWTESKQNEKQIDALSIAAEKVTDDFGVGACHMHAYKSFKEFNCSELNAIFYKDKIINITYENEKLNSGRILNLLEINKQPYVLIEDGEIKNTTHYSLLSFDGKKRMQIIHDPIVDCRD